MTREALWGVLGAAFGIACGGEPVAQAPGAAPSASATPAASTNGAASATQPASSPDGAGSATPAASAAAAATAAVPAPSVSASEVTPRPAPTALATPDENRIPVGWYLPPGAPAPPPKPPPKPAPPAPPSSGRGTLADIGGSAVCGASSCGQKSEVAKTPKFQVRVAMPARQDLPGDGTARAERTVVGLTSRIRACMARAWNMNPTIAEREHRIVLEVHADGGKKIGYVRPQRADAEPDLERCIESAVASRFGGDDAPAVAEMTIGVTKE